MDRTDIPHHPVVESQQPVRYAGTVGWSILPFLIVPRSITPIAYDPLGHYRHGCDPPSC